MYKLFTTVRERECKPLVVTGAVQKESNDSAEGVVGCKKSVSVD